MKAIIWKTLLLLVFISNISMAQRGDSESRKEKMKALKIAFITEELSLTSTEAQQFWPVYNEYEAAMEQLKKEHRQNRLSEDKEMTDKEMNAWLDNQINLEERKVATKKNHISKFKKVLPIKKVVTLMNLEHKFKRQLLQKMREHRQRDGGGKDGRRGRF